MFLLSQDPINMRYDYNNVRWVFQKMDIIQDWVLDIENWVKLNFLEFVVLARKFLSIQASSAAYERIFWLPGQVLSIKICR